MRSVVQRVARASVTVGGDVLGTIETGLVALIGVEAGDTLREAQYLGDKLAKLRVFEDEAGKMNLSVQEAGGAVMAVSQFTLLGDARGQNRPGFVRAEEPVRAQELFDACCERVRSCGIPVVKGRFREHMQVSLVNDGPVTILLDSRKLF